LLNEVVRVDSPHWRGGSVEDPSLEEAVDQTGESVS